MKITLKYLSYQDQPCDRCGSKRKVSKTWFEVIPTITGTTKVECSQIICTNVACQAAFDENIVKETKKREAIRLVKEERDSLRKATALHASASKNQNKHRSRI